MKQRNFYYLLRVLLLTAFSFLALLSWQVGVLATEAEVEAKDRAIVLLYHHIDTHPLDGGSMSPQLFRDQMQYLKQNGYHVIALSQLTNWLKPPEPRPISTEEYSSWEAGNLPSEEKTELPNKAVVITFDDGYNSFYEYAYPVLREFQYPATMFTIVGRVDKRSGEIPKLSWQHIKEMSSSGLVDFQSHTYNKHYRIKGEPALLKVSELEAEADLRQAKQTLTEKIGHQVEAIAYPYGAYNSTIINIAKRSGYNYGFTTKPGAVEKRDNPMELPRISVGSDYTKLGNFSGILRYYFMCESKN